VSHADALNPQDLVQRLVDLLEPLLLKQGNTISFTSNWPTHLNILANQSLLESVLENLFANANKFTANGRICVDLTGHTDGDEIDLRITVTDNGIGIAPEKIDSVFDDFATGDAGYTRTSEGTGLGLGIVKRATKKLGGQIAVESAPQKGSAFTFSGTFKHVPSGDFTSAGSAITPEISDHRAPQNRNKPHVLVVDDNATNHTLIGRMLERLE
jgi:signal transduction histidine kinase